MLFGSYQITEVTLFALFLDQYYYEQTASLIDCMAQVFLHGAGSGRCCVRAPASSVPNEEETAGL